MYTLVYIRNKELRLAYTLVINQLDYWWIPRSSDTGYTKISRGYRLLTATEIDRLCIGPCACGITSEYEKYIGSRILRLYLHWTCLRRI